MQAAQRDPTLEILLVEDNPADVTLIREGLREAKTKHHLSVAIDGDEAIRFLRREGRFASAPRPHLVLLDLNLPKRLGHRGAVRRQDRSEPEANSDPDLHLVACRDGRERSL